MKNFSRCPIMKRRMPEEIASELIARLAQDVDIAVKWYIDLMKRDEKAPSPEYVFEIPDEIKEILPRVRARRKKNVNKRAPSQIHSGRFTPSRKSRCSRRNQNSATLL